MDTKTNKIHNAVGESDKTNILWLILKNQNKVLWETSEFA